MTRQELALIFYKSKRPNVCFPFAFDCESRRKDRNFDVQWCPDISPGSVQSDNGTIWGVGHKTVPLPHRCIWLKLVHFFALFNANRQCHYKEILVR